MEKPVNLLWTSGSDSTFRLLELLLLQKRIVQPYYVMDRTRKSIGFELEAMEKIKRLIFSKNSGTEILLRPTIFKELQEVQADEDISQQYKRLASREHLGIQYDWLPRFAKNFCLYDLELSITSGEHSDSYFRRFVTPSLVKIDDGGFSNYQLMENPADPDLGLFRFFRFPIIDKSKLDMQNIAKKYGFSDIMQHTWFCHAPIHGKPCGICNPCKIAIKEGMWERIPVRGLLRNFFQTTIKPLFKTA
jgi:hypothetical protein